MAAISNGNGTPNGELQNAAVGTLTKLVDSLLAWRNAQFLFYSNINGDKAPSITVSALSVLALHETKRREAQLTCGAMLERRSPTPPNKGAWKAQTEDYFHTFGTSWAVFGCLRVRPTCVADLADSVEWLISQRPQGESGWGHTQETPARAFDTAYVLNALMEFRECAVLIGFKNPDLLRSINEAIEGGVNFLLDASNPEDEGLYIWDRDPKNPGICLATTAVSIHVLTKFQRNSPKGKLLKGLNRALDYLCPLITPESVKANPLSVKLNGKAFDVDLWPNFNSNSPRSYWNRYFTPILAVTFLDFYSEADSELREHLRTAILTFVEWVINNTRAAKDGRIGVRGDTGTTPYVWSTAQGIVILRRWLDALETFPELRGTINQPVPVAPATRTLTTTRLAEVFAKYFEKSGLYGLLSNANESLNAGELLLQNGTPQEICLDMFRRLENYPEKTLAVLIEAEKKEAVNADLKILRETFFKENFYANNH